MKRDAIMSKGLFTLLVITMLLAFHSLVVAEDESVPNLPDDVTASEPEISVDHLQIVLRPLTKEELEIEVQAWLDLLRSQIREVGRTELEIQELKDGESSEALEERLVALRTTETDLTERARVVVAALEAKGGDIKSTQQFIDAVSDITETTDVTSFRAAVVAEVTNWAGREDGGKYWLRRSTFALLILLVFWVASRFAGRITARSLSHNANASVLLENFARRTAGGVVMVVGILTAIAALGVQIGPLMAALGAGGFIVGFALQETLGNFASGLMIMVYRPFDVNDYVSITGVEGTVQEMSLVSTTLVTCDNKVLVIPNKKAWSETITNYTGRDTRRVDMLFSISYDDDIQHATEMLLEIANHHRLTLDEPPTTVHVDHLADSSVDLFCRPWVKTEDYWTVRSDITRQVKERFDADGISIPFPQRELHLQKEAVLS